MNTSYFNAAGNAVAINFKVASATLARAIIRDFQPQVNAMLTTEHGAGNGTAYPEGLHADRMLWQPLAQKIPPESVTLAHLLVREPVEKFRSACQMSRVADVDSKLAELEAGYGEDPHFWPQSRFCSTALMLYRFPDHLDALALAVGLALPLPVVNDSGSIVQGEKPVLTEAQTERVLAIYAEDMALFESITAPGQLRDADAPQPASPSKVAESLRKQLLAFRDSLTAEQRGRLFYPMFDAIKRALDNRDLDAVTVMVANLPWESPGDDAIKAAALALLAS